MKTTEHPKTCPRYFHWRRIGAAKHADYQVKYWRNNGPSKYTGCTSLTEARKTAIALIRECSATTAEVFRYAENGVSIVPIIQCEYGA